MIAEYNNKKYYCDGTKPKDHEYRKFFSRRQAVEETDYYLARRKLNFFNGKKLTDGFGDLEWLASFFSRIKQPTEADVKRALILNLTVNTGDGPMEKYSLKSGGGSASDSIFVSSLSVVVRHPKTGEDTWITLIKKYSTEFPDVLITYQELYSLFEQTSSTTQRIERDFTHAKDVIGFLLGSFRCGKLNFSDKPKPLTDENVNALITKTKSQVKDFIFEKAFGFFDKRFKDSLTHRFEEKPGIDVNAEHIADVHRDMQNLEKIKLLFKGKSYNEVIKPSPKIEVIQTSLFEAA